jgi:TolB-like protein/Tfp pilus assembly protein PilF
MGNDIAPPPPLPASRERKLVAILSADVVGYSRLMSADEAATLDTLAAYRGVTDVLIHQHRGRIVNTAGDSVLAEFASAVDAVQCAVDIQHSLHTRNTELPPERKMEFRIGINVGDVMIEGEQIYGDGVNVAARLQALADAGGVYISGTVYDQIESKLPFTYEYLGEQTVKNIAKPVRTYRVVLAESENQKSKGKNQKAKVDGQESSTFQVQGSKRSRVRPVVFVLVFVSVLLVAGIIAVRYLTVPTLNTHHVTRTTSESLPLPDKPSIVILPFANLSNDPEQEYFSDGLTEDLTSALSKLSSLFVISRNTASTFKGKPVKVQEVSRELGVQYVLEGSVRKADGRVRVTAQLIDALQDHHLWTERYDRPLKDIFALQDEIVQKIVTTLKLQLALWEQGVLVRKTTDNLEAYDFYLRGRESGIRAWIETKKEANVQAQQLLEKAVELDPTYAEAYARLGLTYSNEWFLGWNRDFAQTVERAFELGNKAVALDNSLSGPHQILGFGYLFRKQHDQAIAEAQQAVTLDPNDANAYVNLGTILVWAGRPQEAIGLIETGIRLNPRFPTGYLNHLSAAYRLTGRYEEAVAASKKLLARNPNFMLAHLQLANCYAQMGRLDEARAAAAEVLRIMPHFSLEALRQSFPFKDPAVLERELAALRKAGLK